MMFNSISQTYINADIYTKDKGKNKNRLLDDVWEIIDPVTEKHYNVCFSDYFDKVAWQVLAKQLYYPENVGIEINNHREKSRMESDGTIYRTAASNSFLIRNLVLLSDAMQKHFPKRPLSSLTVTEICLVFECCLTSAQYRDRKTLYAGVRSYSSYNDFYHVLSSMWSRFQRNELADGFKELPDKEYLHKTLPTIIGRAASDDFDFALWKKGGNLAGISVPASIALLSSAIDILRSDETKWLSAIVLTKKEMGWEFASTDQLRRSLERKFEHPQQAARITKCLEHAIFLFDVEHKDQLPKFTFESLNSELMRRLRITWTSAYLVFLIMAGARRNELDGLKFSDLEPQVDGNYKFASNINKTNYGLRSLRFIGGLIAEVVDILSAFYTPQELSQSELFVVPVYGFVVSGQSNNKRKTNIADVQTSLRWLNIFVEEVFNPYHDVSLAITELQNHMFRHCWAEFALRRFDGVSVPYLIRNHFRHSFHSYMTPHYLSGKVYEEDDGRINREYIAELIGRAAQGNEQLFAPIGQFIHQQLESFEFVGEDEVQAIVDQFDGHLEAHEYGFCVLRRETETLAACYDKGTQTPNTGQAQWSKCGGCVHRLTLGGQKENIMRIGASIQASKKSFSEAGLGFMVSEYDLSLKRAKSALDEIIAYENGKGNV